MLRQVLIKKHRILILSPNKMNYILQSLEWRRVNGVDDILEKWSPPEVLTKYYSFGTFGYDKFGSQGKNNK